MSAPMIEVHNSACVTGPGVVGTCDYTRVKHSVQTSPRLKAWQRAVAAAVSSQCSRTDHVTMNPKRAGMPHPKGRGVYRLGTRGEVMAALAENNVCATRAINSAKSGARIAPIPMVAPRRGLEYYRQ